MKKILITGGAGFIGSKLWRRLVDKGYTITVLDNLSSQIHGLRYDLSKFDTLREKVSFIKGDVRYKSDWKRAMKNQDVVIHLAAETGTGQSMYQNKKYCDVNVIGTANLADVLVAGKHNIRKVVLASSRAVYGEGKYLCDIHNAVYPPSRSEADMMNNVFEQKCPECKKPIKPLPTDESSFLQPVSVYGATKLMQENILKAVCKPLSIPIVIFRYQNVYGPGQSLKNPYTGILSIFSNLIKNGKSINIFEDGYESRDFVFIDDVVEATIAGMENSDADNGVFNIGTGTPITVKQLADKLIRLYGADTTTEIKGNFRIGDIRHNFADISKLKNVIKNSPEVTFNEGIIKFVEWVNSQGIAPCNYDKSIYEMKKRGLYR